MAQPSASGVRTLARQREPIYHVGTQWMPHGQLRMFEGFAYRLPHTQARHHLARAGIVDAGDGDEFADGMAGKGVLEHNLRGFSGEALAPVSVSQLPSDFDARYDSAIEVRAGETNQANRLAIERYEVAAIAVALVMLELTRKPSLHL